MGEIAIALIIFMFTFSDEISEYLQCDKNQDVNIEYIEPEENNNIRK